MSTDRPKAPWTPIRGSLRLVLVVGVALASLVVMHGLITSHAVMPGGDSSAHVMTHDQVVDSTSAVAVPHAIAGVSGSAMSFAGAGTIHMSGLDEMAVGALDGKGAMCLAVLTGLLLLTGAHAFRVHGEIASTVGARSRHEWSVVLADPCPPDPARLSVLRM